jgi:simple sugar transport system permease protein
MDSAKNLSKDVALPRSSPKMGLGQVFFNKVGNFIDQSTVNGGIFVAIGMAILVYLLLNKTTFGYELKACGYNRFASRYAGINERRNIVLALVIAGALSGLGGGLLYLSGPTGRHYQVLDVLLNEGFDGIAVALLGLSNPIGIIFSALFVSYITLGGNFLQQLDYVPEIIKIIVAIIIYFAAFSRVFQNIISRLVKGKDVETAIKEGAASSVGIERPLAPPGGAETPPEEDATGKGEK